ncbi:MAG: hypothetical protein KME19_08180 [Microcoleus vaginatus WJT46-NPBG5]|jgi:putative transposase|nr:hypothetical protein [Microcoleus vaginatus WJT46-NPBG5]
MVGSLKISTFLTLRDWQADLAQQHLQHTQQLTVIALDHGSVYCDALSQQQQRWQQQGLILFFLPPYSPHRNFF